MFADDTLLFKSIVNIEDTVCFQRYLNNLCDWSVQNKMTFKHVKETLLKTLDGHQVESVITHKYLGVYLDHKLSWNVHTDQLISKANRMVGLVFNIAGSIIMFVQIVDSANP